MERGTQRGIGGVQLRDDGRKGGTERSKAWLGWGGGRVGGGNGTEKKV